MKAIFATLCCVSGLLALRPARAADSPRGSARLQLERHAGTEQCIDARALTRAVEARLRRRAFREDLPATLYVQITMDRTTDAGWSVEITMRDGLGASLGTRSIATQAAHCSALDDSLALVVALLVDSPPTAEAPAERAPAPATAASAPGPEAPALPVAPRTPAPSQRPSARAKTSTITLPRATFAPREPWRLAVGLEGTAAAGLVPGIAPGIELGVSGKPPTLPEIRVFGALYPTREQQRAGASSGARFSFADIGLELCPLEWALGAVHWVGCAGQSIGWVRVAAFGFDENTTTTHLTYALLGWTGLTLPIFGSLAARLGIRAEVPLERGIFTYGDRTGGERDLFQMKPVTGVLDVGLFVRL